MNRDPGPSTGEHEITYALGSPFVLRMAGFPVEEIQSLRAPRLVAAIEAQRAAEGELEAAKVALLALLRELGAAWRGARGVVGKGRPVDLAELATEPSLPEPGRRYNAALAAVAERTAASADAYAEALTAGRQAVHTLAARDRFRRVLQLSSPDLDEHLPVQPDPLPERNSHWRQREVTMVSYLQRLTTKNETISFFGPAVWGKVDPASPTAVEAELGEIEIARREILLECWVCDALAAVISTDPDARPLLQPTIDDATLIEGRHARRLASGEVVELDAEEAAALARCDGQRRAAEVGPVAVLDRLVERGVVHWALRVPMGPRPFTLLRAEVAAWPDGPARQRWMDRLDRIDACRGALATAVALAPRKAALASLRQALEACGASAQKDSKALYASRLPFNEECVREFQRLTVGQPFLERATGDLRPWYELWRDLVGLYVTRIHAAATAIWQRQGAARLRLPEALALLAAGDLPLGRTGGSGLLPDLEQELRRAWHEQLGSRGEAREVTLTDDDLSFVRRRFTFRRAQSFDLPAPDFQIQAQGMDALRRGDWRLVLGEIHPDYVLWQNCFHQWCPDPQALVRDYARSRHGAGILFDRHMGQTNAHTAVCAYEYTEGWHATGPVHFDGVPHIPSATLWARLTSDDLIVEDEAGRPLGSLLHTWAVALNTHQLELQGLDSHSPRLCVGRVVVQREAWSLKIDDELRRHVDRPSPQMVAALRGLRAEMDLPEEVFVWPQLPRRLTVHKDAKPYFVDFRSPLLLELLAADVRKYPRLRIVEMLPSTSDCWLGDARGHYSCELRFNTLP